MTVRSVRSAGANSSRRRRVCHSAEHRRRDVEAVRHDARGRGGRWDARLEPARRAKRPRIELEPVVPFTLEELDRLRAAAPPWFRVALTLGAAAGLRQGEATGLTVDRLNLLGRTLTVDRQLAIPSSGEAAFVAPKTSRSFRTVPLADIAVDELAVHLHEHGPGVQGLVLHEDGHAISRAGSAASGAHCAPGRSYRRRGSTTRGTRKRRHCFPVACRWRPLPTTWAILRRCCCARTRTWFPPTTTGAHGVQAAFSRTAEDSLRTTAAS